MKKMIGFVLMALLLGAMVSTAKSGPYVAARETSNEQYEAFWKILDREAELVVRFNTTQNISLAPILIENSRLGAKNAANISALIWQALEELKTSGVKMYYTAEELREMAKNISRGGLPEETVRTLKNQGWTDEEIRALEEYIAGNSDEINEDFNMTAFLEEFSMAFIDVAFKYNHYETWTLEKWKWKHSVDINPSAYKGDRMINPLLADEWVKFYRTYEIGNIEGMEYYIEALRKATYQLIVSDEYWTEGDVIFTNLTGENLKVIKMKGLNPSPVIRARGGGLVIKLNPLESSWRDEYYWRGALESYRLVSNVESLVEAIRNGNSNPKVRSILNEKVAELKGSLIVHKRNPSIPPIKPPIKEPINPIKPPEPPVTLPMATKDTTLDPLERRALDVKNNEGILRITEINVIMDNNNPDSPQYHVQVTLAAENNAINNIQINVDDRTSGDSDSGSVSFLNSGETYTWESTRFEVTHPMDGELVVNGIVEVTYEPSCGQVPTSQTFSSCGERTIQEEYSDTFDLSPPIDWNKVHLTIKPADTSITTGESVTYRVVVTNEDDAPLNGLRYSITIPYSLTNSRTYSGTVDVPKNGEEVLLEQTVTYEDASTYVTHASIYWNGKSKSAEASVTVSSDQDEERSINGAFSFSPSIVYEEDAVTFHYVITTSRGQLSDPTVTLEIDNDQKIFEKTYYGVIVSPDSYLEDYVTHTFDNAGMYRITLKVNGLPLYSKTIEVSTPTDLTLSLECPSDPVLLGETGVCNIIVKKNTLSSNVPYSITSKTLDNDEDTSKVISADLINDVIPAKFSGKIAEVVVPLDEKMAEALELSDVRDLTPRINVWSCEDGTCHYTLKRADTPHYLRVTVRLGSDQYMSLEGIILARYTGSKYWNEDTNDSIKKGALMIIAPLGLTYAPADYVGTMIVEMTPAPKPVKTIIQVFLFAKSIGQSIWKEINLGG